MADELLTAQEAADFLRVKKTTLYAMVKRNELSATKIGKQLRISRSELEALMPGSVSVQTREPEIKPVPTGGAWLDSPKNNMVLCGQDSSLDLIASHLTAARGGGTVVLRTHIGSYDSLAMLYHGQADITVIHLWNEEMGEYNLPYIKAMLPGQSVVMVRLFGRSTGLYVKRGNPKHIRDWCDLCRRDLVLVNRERGSGTRVLLDEKLKAMGVSCLQINGYRNEQVSHLAVASAVARGEGDMGLGTQAAARQMLGVSFVPLQQEWYDMVFLAEREEDPSVQAVLDFICSGEFARELSRADGYDLSQTGNIFRF